MVTHQSRSKSLRHAWLNSSLIDWLGLVGGGVIIILTRWLYRSIHLFHWDSIQFALGLEKFNLAMHQPHPPGYIIYIWLGRLANYFTHDANSAFVVINIVASIAGLYFTYQLARVAFGRAAGWLAGLWFIFNAAIWFHGLVAEVYIVETAIITGVIWLSYRYLTKPKLSTLLWLVGVLGLLGGIRQTGEAVMVPLVIYVIWQAKAWRDHLKYAVPVWLAANLVWAVPLLISVGGLNHYVQINWQLIQAMKINLSDANLRGQIIDRAGFAVTLLYQAMLPGLILIGLGGLPFITKEATSYRKINWRLVWFWLLTIVPGLVFLILVWLTNNGYVLFTLPVLLALSAGATMVVAGYLGEFNQFWRPVIIVVATIGMIGFQFYQFFYLSPGAYDYLSASRQSINLVETGFDVSDEIINRQFDPNNTVIVSANNYLFFGFRQYQYYYPKFDVYALTPKAFTGVGPLWHAKGHAVTEFADAVTIGPNIRYVLRTPSLSPVGPGGEQYEHSLKALAIDVDWAYYDLSDPATRQWLQDNQTIKFNFVSQ